MGWGRYYRQKVHFYVEHVTKAGVVPALACGKPNRTKTRYSGTAPLVTCGNCQRMQSHIEAMVFDKLSQQ